MVQRIATGIKGFDKLCEGGLPVGSITLVSGTPGTGKSIFCAQIAYYNATHGKKCLYLDLEQKEGRLEMQMEEFGWNLKKVKNNLKIVSLNSADPKTIDFMLSQIEKDGYDLIVLDSLDSISSTPLPSDEVAKMGVEKIVNTVVPTIFNESTVGRMKLKKIFTAISKSGATALLTSERVEGGEGISRDTISEFLCDNIILMHYLGVGAGEFRSLQIRKMRLSNHEKGIILFSISDKGIVLEEDPMKKGNNL